jgi:phospholipid/cholesterol/gamma-HCH transport system permease protein
VSTSAGPVLQGSEYSLPGRDQDLWDRSADAFGRVPSPLRRVLIQIGQLGQLLTKVVSSAVRQPIGYWGDVIEEMYSMLRYAWMPSVVAIGGFVLVMSNYAYALVTLVGAQSRVSTYLVMAIAREIAPFCTGMAVAGVLGTALTADLGARRVREELDALEVLGINVIRSIVLPRVISITFLALGLVIVGLLIGLGAGLVAASVLNNTSVGTFMANFLAIMTTAELVGVVVKTLLTGLFIGIVCAQKGLATSGGPEGVGKAVNQSVVICFIAVFIINFCVNAVTLGLSPEMMVNR